MEYEWGPWIEHDGMGCPCVGSVVHVVYGDSAFQEYHPVELVEGNWDGRVISVISPSETIEWAESGGSWDWVKIYYPILRYQIRKPLVKEWLKSLEIKEPVVA